MDPSANKGARPDTGNIREGGYQPTSDPGPVPSDLIRQPDSEESRAQRQPSREEMLRFAKAVSNPARAGIIHALGRREANPGELARSIGAALSTTHYLVGWLRREGLIEVARTEPRRGSIVHYYRLSDSAFPLALELDPAHIPSKR